MFRNVLGALPVLAVPRWHLATSLTIGLCEEVHEEGHVSRKGVLPELRGEGIRLETASISLQRMLGKWAWFIMEGGRTAAVENESAPSYLPLSIDAAQRFIPAVPLSRHHRRPVS